MCGRTLIRWTAPGFSASGSVKRSLECDRAWIMARRGFAMRGFVGHRSAIQRLGVRTLDRGAIHDDDNLALSN